MKGINATNLHRKSGQWDTQLSLPVKHGLGTVFGGYGFGYS
jgi:hypothetical protein